MSIYDQQFNEDPKKPAQQPAADQAPWDQLASPSPPVADAKLADGDDQAPESPRRRGCGCRSCLLAFLVLGLVCLAICGVGGYLGVKNAPDWAHRAVVAAVNDSDLSAEDKQKITAEMDRLLAEYKAGNVSQEQVRSALEELGKSPLPVLIMAYAAMENFVTPSGLSDTEKAEAKLAFQRIARGTFQKKIDPDDLETALNYVSKKDFNGNRQLKSRVSDEELRSLVKECTRVADEAEIPNEPFEVEFAAEVKRIVDRALGTTPADETVPTE